MGSKGYGREVDTRADIVGRLQQKGLIAALCRGS